MRVIAVSNQKGGVGKTTTAVNLASILARDGSRVLFVDLDPQANATSGFGVDPKIVYKGSYDALLGEKVEDCIVQLGVDQVDVMPATLDLSGAEIELVSMLGRELRLKEALEPLYSIYDYIFIDTPPTLGLLTVNALTAASYLLIPLQCEYYAMEGLSQLLRTVELVKKRLNTSLDFIGIVLTMYDRRNNLSSQVESEIRNHFKDKVFHVVIPRNVKLSEAPSHGKPVVYYDAGSSGARAYIRLTDELEERLDSRTQMNTSNNTESGIVYV